MKKLLLTLALIFNFYISINTANAIYYDTPNGRGSLIIDSSVDLFLLSVTADFTNHHYKKEIQIAAKKDFFYMIAEEEINLSPVIKTKLRRENVDLENFNDVQDALKILVQDVTTE